MTRFRAHWGLCALALCLAGWVHAQELLPATLRITSSVPALISLDHATPFDLSTAQTVKVVPGKATLIKVSAPGYGTQYRTVTLQAAERRLEAFKLERDQVPVLLRSNVPATVTLDGIVLGQTPCYTFLDEPRAYRFLFRAPGYEQTAHTLLLRDTTPQVIDQELSPTFGDLRVTSTPAARLLLNGVDKGQTPVTLHRLNEGEYTLTLRLSGYKPINHTFTLKAGETPDFAFTFEPLPAGLTITAVPANSRVYLDGIFRGMTDLTLNDLPEGNHLLRVEKQGYSPVTRTITLKRGEKIIEEFTLPIVRGTVTLQTQPGTVTAYQGTQKVLETSPKEAGSYTSSVVAHAMPPGQYTWTLKAPGYAPATRTFTITANQVTPLKVRLTFQPNFELRTEHATFQGVFIKRSEIGAITLELKPGSFRTFIPDEIISQRFLTERL